MRCLLGHRVSLQGRGCAGGSLVLGEWLGEHPHPSFPCCGETGWTGTVDDPQQ